MPLFSSIPIHPPVHPSIHPFFNIFVPLSESFIIDDKKDTATIPLQQKVYCFRDENVLKCLTQKET